MFLVFGENKGGPIRRIFLLSVELRTEGGRSSARQNLLERARTHNERSRLRLAPLQSFSHGGSTPPLIRFFGRLAGHSNSGDKPSSSSPAVFANRWWTGKKGILFPRELVLHGLRHTIPLCKMCSRILDRSRWRRANKRSPKRGEPKNKGASCGRSTEWNFRDPRIVLCVSLLCPIGFTARIFYRHPKELPIQEIVWTHLLTLPGQATVSKYPCLKILASGYSRANG
jgi:hypothetical protein